MLRREIVNYGYPLLALFLGVVLVWASLPRFRAAFNHLPVDVAINHLHDGKNLPSKKLASLIETSQATIELHAHPRYWSDISQLLFFQAEKNKYLKLKKRALLKKAEYSAKKSLAWSPANSWLWYRLANIHFLSAPVSEKTAEALNLSIMTGPYELGHLFPRLALCLQLFPRFDEQDRFLLRSQVLIAWKKAPQLFIDKLTSGNDYMDKIRLLLHNQHDDVLAVIETEIENAH